MPKNQKIKCTALPTYFLLFYLESKMLYTKMPILLEGMELALSQ
jgi:hypothetical protein